MMQTVPPNGSRRIRFAGGVFLASVAIYILTCAPGLVWQDSAIFQMRVAQFDLHSRLGLALAHPLYIVLCKAFTLLPFGSQAFRVNLFSGFCAAGCLAILCDLLLNLTANRVATLSAVILLGVSHTFWKHAVLAEVMTLYALGLAAELWLVERYFARNKPAYLIAALFINGLSASNHLLALLHLPAYGILAIWLHAQRRIGWTHWLLAIAAYFAGLTPYLSLCIAEHLHGRGLGEVVRSALFGDTFGSAVLNTSVPIARQLGRTLEYFALNFPTPLVLAALPGLAWLRFGGRRGAVTAFALAIFVVDFVFAFRYPVPDQYVFYFPCYVAVALFVGMGLSTLLSRSSHSTSIRTQAICVVLALMPAGLYEVCPALVKRAGLSVPFRQDVPYRDAYVYFLRPRMNGDDGAERFSREALGQMPQGGVLIADSSENNALAYVRDIEGVRRDVVLTLPCDGVLAAPTTERSREGLQSFVASGTAYATTANPVYLLEWINHEMNLQPVGILFKVVPKR